MLYSKMRFFSTLNEGRIILPTLIAAQFVSLILSAMNGPALFRSILVLPCLFIIPGMLLIIAVRPGSGNLVKLAVEGFFVSILMVVFLTSFMFAFNVQIAALNYSLFAFSASLLLAIIAFKRKARFEFSKTSVLLIILAFLLYGALILNFYGYPRYFTADETSYIFSSRQGIFDGTVTQMGLSPNSSVINAFFQGRYLWTYLLATFLGFTGLSGYQSGLINIAFLVMTALASTLLLKNNWLHVSAFLLVLCSPTLLLLADLALNDLAVSFFAVFSVVFFVKSFSESNGKIAVNQRNLVISLLATFVLTLIKPNVLVLVGMAIVLLFVFFRYKLYKNWRRNILIMTLSIILLVYEFFVDIPYVISVWILRSSQIASWFHQFLVISPAERLLYCFVTPYWASGSPTLFNQTPVNYVSYFYTLLSPESNLLVAAILLGLPFLFLFRKLSWHIENRVLASVVLVSFYLFYLEALVSVSIIGDVSRYSLWLIPLSIPLTLLLLSEMLRSRSSTLKLLPILVLASLLFCINFWLTVNEGGVFTGFGIFDPILTTNAIVVQFFSFAIITGLVILLQYQDKIRSKIHFVIRKSFSKKVFVLAVILMVFSELYFGIQVVDSSKLFVDHGLSEINTNLNSISSGKDLVFANDFIYARIYANETLLDKGLLLPPPETEAEFYKLIMAAPNNTLFAVSSDNSIAWYEYANAYMKNLVNNYIIETAADTYAVKTGEVNSANGKTAFFRVIDGNSIEPAANVSVNTQEMTTDNNNTVKLDLLLTSDSATNCTLLLSTDRFTKVYNISLSQGSNDVKFEYPYYSNESLQEASPYWPNLSQSRVIVINNGAVIFNRLVSPLKLSSINIYLLLVIALILPLFILVTMRLNSSKIKLNNSVKVRDYGAGK